MRYWLSGFLVEISASSTGFTAHVVTGECLIPVAHPSESPWEALAVAAQVLSDQPISGLN